jgi:hypothetical protein
MNPAIHFVALENRVISAIYAAQSVEFHIGQGPIYSRIFGVC